jgi:hypothetical protein
MPRKTPDMKIEVMPGAQYPDLESAQRAALPSLAEDLAETLRRLLAEGWLINSNGRIIPNPERTQRK